MAGFDRYRRAATPNPAGSAGSQPLKVGRHRRRTARCRGYGRSVARLRGTVPITEPRPRRPDARAASAPGARRGLVYGTDDGAGRRHKPIRKRPPGARAASGSARAASATGACKRFGCSGAIKVGSGYRVDQRRTAGEERDGSPVVADQPTQVLRCVTGRCEGSAGEGPPRVRSWLWSNLLCAATRSPARWRARSRPRFGEPRGRGRPPNQRVAEADQVRRVAQSFVDEPDRPVVACRHPGLVAATTM